MVILVETAEESEANNKTQKPLMADNNKEEEEAEEKDVKWVKYYSSIHQILLVGDGDFSFSLCLANSFGSASNIVTSSLDSYDVVTTKYKNAKANLEKLVELGAYVLHGVDATTMKLHTDLQKRKFDRIIYNFPHAGFHGKEENRGLIRMHRSLVQGFFKNASGMLREDGEVHVTHKTTAPFNKWNIEDLANQNSLALIECVDFKIKDYPGYNNKRGDGKECDEPFHLGKCSTFKFKLSSNAKKTRPLAKKSPGSPYTDEYQLQMMPTPMPHRLPGTNFGSPYSYSHQLQMIQAPIPRQPPENRSTFMNSGPSYGNMHQSQLIQTPVPQCMPSSSGWGSDECRRVFSEYFDHAIATFGIINYDVRHSVQESLRLGFERYAAEQPGRPLNDDLIQFLEELRHLSILRSRYLQNMLRDDFTVIS